MRLETRTVRIGEKVGPVDRDFDYGDDHYRDDFLAMVEGVERGEEWKATTDSGWPRVGWGRVLDVGMYDGWPYWKPTPSFLLDSWMGASWHSFVMLSGARRIPQEDTTTC